MISNQRYQDHDLKPTISNQTIPNYDPKPTIDLKPEISISALPENDLFYHFLD